MPIHSCALYNNIQPPNMKKPLWINYWCPLPATAKIVTQTENHSAFWSCDVMCRISVKTHVWLKWRPRNWKYTLNGKHIHTHCFVYSFTPRDNLACLIHLHAYVWEEWSNVQNSTKIVTWAHDQTRDPGAVRGQCYTRLHQPTANVFICKAIMHDLYIPRGLFFLQALLVMFQRIGEKIA